MKAFLIVLFVAAVTVAFLGALTLNTPLYHLGGVLTVLILPAAYLIDRINTYLEGEDQ